MWGPYLVEPVDKVLDWSRQSLVEFTALAVDESAGVRLTSGIEAARHPMKRPDWADLVPDMRRCRDLPDGFVEGFRFTVPLIDMPVYLGHLRERLLRVGGSIKVRTVRSWMRPSVRPASSSTVLVSARETWGRTATFTRSAASFWSPS